MRRIWPLVFSIGLCISEAVSGQQAPDGQQSDPAAAQGQMTAPQRLVGAVRGLSQDYRIGVGDTLEIQVVDSAELTQTIRVSSSGEINILPAGAIHAADLTAAELEAKIASILQEKKLLVKPQILVYVREYKARKIYAVGEFAFPGEFVMSQHLTVMDAILLAGGLGVYPESHGYLHHRLSSGSPDGPPPQAVIEKPDAPREGTEVIRIDLRPLEEGRLPVPNPTLQQGDCLIVPRAVAQSFFVLGEVLRPLNYPFPRGKTLLVSQAIAQAGGPTTTAKMSEGMLVRYDAKGERQEIKTDFDAIIRGKQQDFKLQPNDVVFIPGSIIKTIAEGYLRAANAMIAGTAFRVGRTYQLPEPAEPGQPPPN